MTQVKKTLCNLTYGQQLTVDINFWLHAKTPNLLKARSLSRSVLHHRTLISLTAEWIHEKSLLRAGSKKMRRTTYRRTIWCDQADFTHDCQQPCRDVHLPGRTGATVSEEIAICVSSVMDSLNLKNVSVKWQFWKVASFLFDSGPKAWRISIFQNYILELR